MNKSDVSSWLDLKVNVTYPICMATGETRLTFSTIKSHEDIMLMNYLFPVLALLLLLLV